MRSVRCPLGLIVLLLCWFAVAQGSWAGGLRVDIGRLDHPEVSAQNLSLRLQQGHAVLTADELRLGGHFFPEPQLECSSVSWSARGGACPAGRLALPGWLEPSALSVSYNAAGNGVQASLRTQAGESLNAQFELDGRFKLRFSEIDLARLSEHLDAVKPYAPKGRVNGIVDGGWSAEGIELRAEGQVRDVAFASVSGMEAAEGLTMSVNGSVKHSTLTGWQFTLAAHWQGGEAYIHPFYLESGPTARLTATLLGDQMSIDRAVLRLQGVEAIELSAAVDLKTQLIRSADLSIRGVDLAEVTRRFLLPAFAPALVERLSLDGDAQTRLSVRNGHVQSVDVTVNGLRLSLDDGMLELGPLDASLPWKRDATSRINATVGGGRWESLELGKFPIVAVVRNHEARFEPLSIPLLDGVLRMTDLQVQWLEQGLHGSAGLVLEPVSVELLTAALGWPTMTGVLSASLPGVSLAPGLLKLDGALVVSLFGGYVSVDKLEVREPFGLASYLAADLEARNLDLDKITNTFAFGGITGFIDADVLGLELVRWRPVAFDAHVRSSAGRYSRRISQRAVQNIGALSGGGAVLALQRGVLGFFESFGYRELGLSCRLASNECVMGGVEDLKRNDGSDGGFVIVRGGGIPALNVIGYNRRVNWQDFLSRVQAAIESNAAPRFD